MNTFQEWCKELLPIVQAGTNGEEIEYSRKDSGCWYSFNEADLNCLSFEVDEHYRIKPRTTVLNGFEVPIPLDNLDGVDEFYLAVPTNKDFYVSYKVSVMSDPSIICDLLQRGLCHKTKEDAIAYAKAMCGLKE